MSHRSNEVPRLKVLGQYFIQRCASTPISSDVEESSVKTTVLGDAKRLLVLANRGTDSFDELDSLPWCSTDSNDCFVITTGLRDQVPTVRRTRLETVTLQ